MSLPPQDEAEIRRRQRSRSVVTAIGLVVFAILLYLITIARLTRS